MLKAAHYRGEDRLPGVEEARPPLPVLPAGRTQHGSPLKQRHGGLSGLAMTAADRYALSLLPGALEGSGVAGNDASPQRAMQARSGLLPPRNGIPPPAKRQLRGEPVAAVHTPVQQSSPMPVLDSQMVDNWDASLKQILTALEPDGQHIKPAKLRDHKYPAQHAGSSMSPAARSPQRRELDEALATVPAGGRKSKGQTGFGSPLQPAKGRRLDSSWGLDVRYDVVPSVKLAWAASQQQLHHQGPYTAGNGTNPKKYLSQLVGKTSPHYASQPAYSPPPYNPPPPSGTAGWGHFNEVQLPTLGTPNQNPTNSYGFRGSGYAPPSFQNWMHPSSPSGQASAQQTPMRRHPPFASSTVPSLAKPLTVQYHPVLRTPPGGAFSTLHAPPAPREASATSVSSATPQPTPPSGHLAPLPGRPKVVIELAEEETEAARARHSAALNGVLSGIEQDLQNANPSPDTHLNYGAKPKFLQLYEDPNRPLAQLHPKDHITTAGPAPRPKLAPRPHAADPSQGPQQSPPAGGPVSRSPMFDRRAKLPGLKPSGGSLKRQDSLPQEDESGLRNVHLQPPEVPSSSAAEQPAQEAEVHKQQEADAAQVVVPAAEEAAEPQAPTQPAASWQEGGAEAESSDASEQAMPGGDVLPEAEVEASCSDTGTAASSLPPSSAITPRVLQELLPAGFSGQEQGGAAADEPVAAAAGAAASGDAVVDEPHTKEPEPGDGDGEGPPDAPADPKEQAASSTADDVQQEPPASQVQGGEEPAVPSAVAQAAAEAEAERTTVALEDAPPPDAASTPADYSAAQQQDETAADAGSSATYASPAGELAEASVAAAMPPEAIDREVLLHLLYNDQPAEVEARGPAVTVRLEYDGRREAASAVEAPLPQVPLPEPMAPVASADEASGSLGAGALQGDEAAAPDAVPQESDGAVEQPVEAAEAAEAEPSSSSAPGIDAEPSQAQQEAPCLTSSESAAEVQEAEADAAAEAAGADAAAEAADVAAACSDEQEPVPKPAAEPSEAPAEPSEAPAEPSEAPAEPSEAPAEPSEAPAEPSGEPAEPSEVPAEPSEAPAEPSEAPAEPSEVPAEPSEAPAEQPTASSAESTPAPAANDESVEPAPAVRRTASNASSAAEGSFASFPLREGITMDFANKSVTNIQAHIRGHLARKRAKELRAARAAGEAALKQAAAAAAQRKAAFELPDGVSRDEAEVAATRVQAHMRGHLARKRVARMRAAGRPELPPPPVEAAVAGGAASPADGLVNPDGAAAAAAAAPQEPQALAPADDAPAAASVRASADGTAGELPVPLDTLQELLVDGLDGAKATGFDDDDDVAAGDDDDDDVTAGGKDGKGGAGAAVPMIIAVADIDNDALLRDAEVADGGADDGADVAAADVSRMSAASARTSAMFEGDGAEARFSEGENSGLDVDVLEGLMDDEDEAADAGDGAASARRSGLASGQGELVSISPYGFSAVQRLSSPGSTQGYHPLGPGERDPNDVLEPGNVRVLGRKYEVQHVVGEGAYGMVMKCRVRGSDPEQYVAIKEFKIDDSDPDAEDVKRTSHREVKVLEAVSHPHVVRFVEKFMVGDRLFIVMEFLPCNLLELLEAQPGGMEKEAVRLIMFQLCSAVCFLHTKNMVYRDIKPENLLVDEHGTIKLCDFGFARYLPSHPSSHLTDYVATRWYRAPELLLGPPYRDANGQHVQYMYGPAIDMWAVGCLMGELMDGEPLFAGDSDLDQVYRIQQVLGPMTHQQQAMFNANPHNSGIVFNIKLPMTLAARYVGKMNSIEVDFMARLLEMDPAKRMTGEQCLAHPYLADLTAAAAGTLPLPDSLASSTGTSFHTARSGGSALMNGLMAMGSPGSESELYCAGRAGSAAGPSGMNMMMMGYAGTSGGDEEEEDDERGGGVRGERSGVPSVKSVSALHEVAAALEEHRQGEEDELTEPAGEL